MYTSSGLIYVEMADFSDRSTIWMTGILRHPYVLGLSVTHGFCNSVYAERMKISLPTLDLTNTDTEWIVIAIHWTGLHSIGRVDFRRKIDFE
jgi:hypothetical protein